MGLRCRFSGEQSASALAQPLPPSTPTPSSAATFVDDTCVRCTVPPSLYTGGVDVHVSIGRHAEGPHSAGVQFTYYMPEQPPSLASVDPNYSDVQGGGTLTLKGANFAPTGPGKLLCLFGKALLGHHPHNNKHLTLQPHSHRQPHSQPLPKPEHELEPSVQLKLGDALRADATFVDAATITCVVPLCDPALAVCNGVSGTLQLRATHRGDDAAARSASYLNFTFYDANAAPTLQSVLPAATAQHGALLDSAVPLPLTVHATNLAPTAGALRCKFSGGGWDAEVAPSPPPYTSPSYGVRAGGRAGKRASG